MPAVREPLMCAMLQHVGSVVRRGRDGATPEARQHCLCREPSCAICCRLHQHVDFVVCLGGDGTILHASSLFQRAIPPVISFSAGSLGFLTNHSLQNVEADLRGVIYGSEDLDQCSLEEEVDSALALPCESALCWTDRGDSILQALCVF